MAKVSGRGGFRPKRNVVAKTVTMVIVDAEGEPVTQEVFEFADVHQELRDEVSLYGLQKLLMDRTSQITDSLRGKLTGMLEVMQSLKAGEWRAERETGPRSVSAEVEALAQLKGASIPAIQKSLAAYIEEQRKKILANAKVQRLAQAIREEREKAEQVSLDDMTGEV